MEILLLGLLVFLGTHSIRMVAPGWRERRIAQLGPGAWKGLFAVASLVGFVLLVWGFGLARRDPLVLYAPPLALRHLNGLFTVLAFVLLVAAYVPRNHVRRWVGHPMTLGVALWAIGHLLATGMRRDLVLFGAFALWSVPLYFVALGRERRSGVPREPGSAVGDALVLVIGLAAWAAFAFWLHRWLLGVSPFG